MPDSSPAWDVIVVGAGAAGLATAIFTRARNPAQTVLLLDGARKVGAKILVSGGARCNVTNTVVTERDYWGGPPAIVRRVLRAFPVQDTITFFRQAGVVLHEEADGKLFPDTNRARDVLAALLGQAALTGVELRADHRVRSVARTDRLFDVATAAGTFRARSVVLATGGQSLPKTGSDGGGYAMATSFGHTLVSTTPALAPLVLDPGRSLHPDIPGVSLPAALTVWADRKRVITVDGGLLWTHFGISGPVALDASRHWLRARLEGCAVELTASFTPDRDFPAVNAFWLDEARERPRASVASTLSRLVPGSMATVLLDRLRIDPGVKLAELQREHRRELTRALTAWALTVVDSRGYNYAEATAGGVNLREINPATMESRVRPGLFLVGEMLDVDGRLGGFNFQWAWSSAFVAAAALSAQAGNGAG